MSEDKKTEKEPTGNDAAPGRVVSTGTLGSDRALGRSPALAGSRDHGGN